ncbi:MAG: helix-turn-helix domain-containing protein [Bacteroidota bacterium]
METQINMNIKNPYTIPGINNKERFSLKIEKKKRIIIPSTQEILYAVCKYFEQDPYQVHKKTRKREVVQTRQIAMYFAKMFTKDSLQTIGDKIGGKDHATVLHACKTVENLCDSDKSYWRNIEDLKAQFMYKYNNHPAANDGLHIQTSNMKIYIFHKEKVVRMAQIYPCSFKEIDAIHRELKEYYGIDEQYTFISI